MSLPSIVEAAKADLYTAKEELLQKYAQSQVEHLLRLRDMVTWSIANPDAKDRQFVDEERTRYGLSLVTAYADLKIVKAILPNMGEASRDFHRWRYNEMILETYQMAKKRKDTKTMEKAATSYAKFNRIDIVCPHIKRNIVTAAYFRIIQNIFVKHFAYMLSPYGFINA